MKHDGNPSGLSGAAVARDATMNEMLAVLESIPNVVFFLGLDMRVRAMNRAARAAIDRIRGPIEIGCYFYDFVDLDNLADYERAVHEALQGHAVCIEKKLFSTDGTEEPWEITFDPVILDDGQTAGICVTGHLIDVRKRAEAEIAEWNRRYELVVASSGQIVYDYDLVAGHILWGGSLECVLGYSPEGMGSTLDQWSDKIHPDDVGEATRLLEEAEKTASAYDVDYRFRRKDGDYVWLHDRGFYITNDEGRAIRMLGMIRDVTGRKQTEAALRDSEQRFRSMADTAPVLIWMAGQERHTYYFNRPWLKFTGMSLTRAYGKGWTSAVHPDDLDSLLETYKRAFASRQAFTAEYRLQHSDGTYHWVLDSGVPRLSPEGRITGYIGSSVDISDRKASEEALNESEVRYRNLYNQTPVMLHSIDMEGRLVSVSDYWLEVMGYTRREVLGRKSTEYLTPESRKMAEEVVLPDFRVTGFCKDIPYRFVKKSGEILDVLLSATSERDAQGKLLRSLAVSVDVTERNQAESALRESEQRFRTVADYTYDWEYWMAPDGSFVYVSPSCKRITGYGPEEFISDPELLKRIIHSDDLARFNEHLNTIKDSNDASALEFRIHTRGGECRWIEHSCQVVYGLDGRFLGRRAGHRDVTERKSMEDELRRSEARNRSLLEAIPDMMFCFDAKGTFLDFQADHDQLYVAPEDFLLHAVGDVLPPALAALAKPAHDRLAALRERLRSAERGHAA